MRLSRASRQITLGWWLHLKMLNRSVFDSALQVLWPLFFTTIALLIYRVNDDPEALTYVTLGAGVMTTWTAISSMASVLLQRERGFGTLELLVAAPTSIKQAIASMIAAVTTVGTFSTVATLSWARLVFGVKLTAAQPAWFGVALVTTVASFAVLGFIVSVTVVRYRAAWALGGALEYPVWLICGFLVPIDVLPDWLRPLSMALPPSWGMAAVRAAANGEPVWADIATCLGLTAGYCLAGFWLAETLLRSARRHATLSLS